MKRYLFSGIGLVVLAVLFLLFSVANQALFSGARLDLTENRSYTLSQGTLNILGQIEEPISFTLYYSKGIGDQVPQIRAYHQRVYDLLREYALRSDGKLKLQVIDPEPFSEAEDRAAALRLVPMQVGPGNQVYFGLVAVSGIGTTEVIPFFHPQREPTLEYDLSKLITQVENPERTRIGVLSSLQIAGAWNPAMGGVVPPWEVYREASQLFAIEDLQPPLQEIPEDIKVLWLVHPKELDEQSLYVIDQFVMRGGKLMVFVDPLAEREPPPEGMHPIQARNIPKRSELPKLLEAWGVNFDTGKVLLDPSHALTVRLNLQSRPIQHTALLGLTGDSMNRDDLITAQLNQVNVGYPGALTWEAREGVTVEPLIRSSAQAVTVSEEAARMTLDPSELALLPHDAPARHTLALRLTGALPSAFADGPPEGVENAEHLSRAKVPGSVIVVADVDLLADDYWVQKQDLRNQIVVQPFADNGDLVINALDNLAGNADLISIRSRSVYSRPFERVIALRSAAEQRFKAKEQELQARLEETDRQLQQLKTTPDGQEIVLTPEQTRALEEFQAEKLRIRKELRDVRHQLDQDIESLSTRLKLINIGLVPALVALFGIGVATFRYRRRQKAREANRV